MKNASVKGKTSPDASKNGRGYKLLVFSLIMPVRGLRVKKWVASGASSVYIGK